MPISDEYTLLKIIRENLVSKNTEDIQLSSQDFDDCALVKIDETYSFAITSDFVRGTGFLPFQRGYMNYYDVGWYLIGANLSDLASIGATPTGLTTAIRYGESMSDEDFTEVFRGMDAICKKYNTSIIGGDTGSYDSNVFCATAFGKVETSRALLRKNVGQDHVVCVTGILGDAVASMVYLKNNLEKSGILNSKEEESIFKSWRRVSPRLEEGMILSQNFENVAGQDISDGFKATLLQMSAISGKTFTIKESLLPVSNELKKIAKYLDIDYCQLAFSASVDFELLITLPKRDLEKAQALFHEKGLQLICVGYVNNLDKNNIQRLDGTITEIPGVEWKQQSGDFIKDIIS